MSHGAEYLVVETPVCQRASALVCRCDAKARAGCGSVRGIPLLQARHPEGFNRAHLNDRAKEGEKLSLTSSLSWSGVGRMVESAKRGYTLCPKSNLKQCITGVSLSYSRTRTKKTSTP